MMDLYREFLIHNTYVDYFIFKIRKAICASMLAVSVLLFKVIWSLPLNYSNSILALSASGDKAFSMQLR